MLSLGKIEEFNPASKSINRYLERLEQYFKANSVPADSGDSHKQRAILISVIRAKAYDILSDLCSQQRLWRKCTHSFRLSSRTILHHRNWS